MKLPKTGLHLFIYLLQHLRFNLPSILWEITDMTFYGLCPVRDEFYLVTCNYCQRVCTPQGLKNHIGKLVVINVEHGIMKNMIDCQS